MWDFRLVDWANFLLQPSNGQTYGLSPVWIRTCVRKLKSKEKRFPHPSKVHCGGKDKALGYLLLRFKIFHTVLHHSEKHYPLFFLNNLTWKGFSPVWTNWCRFSLELSTNAFPHSAQTWTRGPWVCKCFLIAELSRNIFVQPYDKDNDDKQLNS